LNEKCFLEEQRVEEEEDKMVRMGCEELQESKVRRCTSEEKRSATCSVHCKKIMDPHISTAHAVKAVLKF
jgi:hypothetical protein